MEEEVLSVKVYNNDYILDAQPKANKIVDNAVSIKYNKHDSDLVINDDESNPVILVNHPKGVRR